MNRISRLSLFGAMILILLTTACAGQDTTPTVSGTLETSTPFGAPTEVTETAGTETATTGTAETAVETPTVSTTATAAISTSTTQTASTAGTGTLGVPVTGVDIVLVECQFCVDTTAHALLVLPDTATFEIVSSSPATTTSTTAVTTTTPSCTTVEVNNGKQVVLCNGPELTPIVLNICTADNACTDFPVDLLACPLAAKPTSAVPSNTPEPGAGATDTPAAVGGTATATIAISTATP